MSYDPDNHDNDLFAVDYELLFNSTPDLYLILDLTLTIVAASDSYLKATMTKREAILGKYIFEVFPDNPNNPSGGSSNLQSSLERVLQKKLPDAMAVQKYDIRKTNGEFEVRYWSPVNTPVCKNNELKYIIHRAEDVTEFIRLKEKGTRLDKITEQQKVHLQQIELDIFKRAQEIQQANKRLRESEERMRLLVEGTKDYAIIMLDPKGYIITWNEGAKRINGYISSEIIGKHFSIFYTQEDRDKQYPAYELQKAKEEGRYEDEAWRVRNDGNCYWVNSILTPIYDEKAHLIGYGLVTRDLTEARKVEQLKNEFVSVVSHELRTPLTSISGSLGLVLGGAAGDLSEKCKNLLKIANSNSERLVKLINDILDMEKLEAGKIEFHFQNCELSKLIKDALLVNEMFAEKFGVHLSMTGFLDDTQVYVDSDRFMQVLTNLISNAVKFSPQDSTVTVSMVAKNDMVRISVSDHGPGISDEFKTHIFEKFSQADASTTRLKTGTGLGLAISKAIVERLGSTLRFESKLNVGTTFYFDLPIAKHEIRADNQPSTLEKDTTLRRVLICESDRKQAEYISSILRSINYSSDIVHSGANAKKYLQERQYDALLMDLLLPDMNGIQLIRDLRTHAHMDVPIIVVSTIAKEGKKILNGYAVEVIDWLEKPVDFNKLTKAFSRIQHKVNKLTPRILHVEDDIDTQELIRNLLSDRSSIDSAGSIKQAKEKLLDRCYDLLILDLLLPDGNGIKLLPLVAEKNIPVIVFARGDLDPKYAHYVKEHFVKSKTTPQKLIESILKILEPFNVTSQQELKDAHNK